MGFGEAGYYGKEHEFYVFGQLATSIKYDFCRERNLEFKSASEVFVSDGSGLPQDTVVWMRGHGTDGKGGCGGAHPLGLRRRGAP